MSSPASGVYGEKQLATGASPVESVQEDILREHTCEKALGTRLTCHLYNAEAVVEVGRGLVTRDALLNTKNMYDEKFCLYS